MVIFRSALDAVMPSHLLPMYISCTGKELSLGDRKYLLDSVGSVYLLCLGKAAASMAKTAEVLLGSNLAGGLVITKYGHACPLQICATMEAGHPEPDEAGVRAAEEIEKFLGQLSPQDILLVLISGGASALVADLPEDISLEDLQALTRLLLHHGASIDEINTVRKHVASLKGGQLVLKARGAELVCFILSDVPGNRLEVIASGPTVPDPTTFMDAWNVLNWYGLTDMVPVAVKKRLERGIQGLIEETPKPGDPAFRRTHAEIIGSNQTALEAAQKTATSLGYRVTITDSDLQGEASAAGRLFAEKLFSAGGDLPVCFLAGGETTVLVKGKGKGGRNQEFVLAALKRWAEEEIGNSRDAVLLSAGTDGTDGPTDAAGAMIHSSDMNKWREKKEEIRTSLENNDSFHFFEKHGGLIHTGPSFTNVMDLVIGLVS